jgi:hypothetical protein
MPVRGGVFFTSPVVASYLRVHPVSVAAARRSSARALPVGVILAIIMTMVVVVGAAALRSRGRQSKATF